MRTYGFEFVAADFFSSLFVLQTTRSDDLWCVCMCDRERGKYLMAKEIESKEDNTWPYVSCILTLFLNELSVEHNFFTTTKERGFLVEFVRITSV